MKNVEMIQLVQVIDKVLPVSKKVKFNYLLNKNKRLIDEEQKTLAEISKPSDKIVEFETKRLELCRTHCTKDDDGNPVLNKDTNRFEGLDKSAKFKKAFEKLAKEYDEAIKENQEKMNQYDELLQEESKVELVKIPIDIVPDDVIAGNDLAILMEIIEE